MLGKMKPKSVKEIKVEGVGEVKEFIGCKTEIDKLESSAKFTQPVMIQLFLDKCSAGQKKQVTTAEPNTVLKKPEPGEILAKRTNLNTSQESEK